MKINHTKFLNVQVIYITPTTDGTPLEQMNNCLAQLSQELVKRNIDLINIVKQTIFLLAGDRKEYLYKTSVFDEAINEFYESSSPSTSFIAQAPGNDKELSLEVYVAGKRSEEIEITHKSVEDIPYTVISSPCYKEVYAAGLNVAYLNDISDQAVSSFTMMQKILAREELSFSDVVRQWNYIEEITKIAGHDTIKQNYQVFNDVRSRFYRNSDFLNGYPSATGIGTFTGGVTIEFVAVSPGDISIYPLNNPGQIEAYKYSDEVLVGMGIPGNSRKTTPKFERGKLLRINDHARIYVSGTAAVVGELSSHADDIERQTLISIENIINLLSPDNLSKYGINVDLRTNGFSYIRTYVKYKADLERVKRICEKHFKSENFQYLISDICRDDLLVEIEGSIFL